MGLVSCALDDGAGRIRIRKRHEWCHEWGYCTVKSREITEGGAFEGNIIKIVERAANTIGHLIVQRGLYLVNLPLIKITTI